MPHLRTCLAAMVATLASTAAVAAPLPVKIERFEGEVVQVIGTVHSGVLPGKNLEQGTQIQTGVDGRAELSLSGAPTVVVGGNADLLVHSVERGVLRLRVASGALRIDSRAAGPHQARDVRLNVGDLRLRISGAEGWTELTDRGGQICLIAGAIDAQQPSGAVRLDVPGQCLRQSGLTAQWSMVPLSVLEERVALLGVQAPAAAVLPKPEPKIKALPLPVEPEPAVVALVEPAPVAEPPNPVAIKPAAAPSHAVIEKAPVTVAAPSASAPPAEPVAPVAKATAPVVIEAKPLPPPIEAKPPPPVAVASAPVPPPVKDPEMPGAASIVAMTTPTLIETPVFPDPPVAPPKAPIAEPVAATPKAPAKPQPKALPAEPSPVETVAAPVSAVTPATGSSASPVKEAVAAKPVAEVALAAPAEPAPEPVVDDGRRWRVVLASMPERLKAEMEAERLNARGWTVEAREYRVGDRHGYRIGFGEFAAREEAQKALDTFMAQAPDATAWLAKY